MKPFNPQSPVIREAIAQADAYTIDCGLTSYSCALELIQAIRNNCRHNPQAPADVLHEIDSLISEYASLPRKV
jgi:hypothetical protein